MKRENSSTREEVKMRLKEKQTRSNHRAAMTFKADFSLIRSGKPEPEGVQYEPILYNHNVLQSQKEGGMCG